MTDTRVLLVAAPFVSQGGVYTSLRRTLPLLPELGVDVGVLWASRIPGGGLPGRWVRRVGEPAIAAWRGPALTRHVARAVREWRPDVLLSVLPQSDVACATVSRRAGIPWVAMIRGRPFPTGGEAPAIKQAVWRLSLTRAYRRASWRVAISHALAEEVRRRLHVDVDEVIHNGVDLAGYAFTERSGPPRIGFVGRLTQDKAPLVVCALAPELGGEVQIIGDGPLRPAIEAAAAADPRVRVRGWMDSHEAMLSVDVLVVPSRREGLGNVILEAGASGVAVVARRVGGIPEILGRDPELARWCLVDELAGPQEFAAAVSALMGDEPLRQALARRLHDVIRRDFTVERAAADLARTLRRIAG